MRRTTSKYDIAAAICVGALALGGCFSDPENVPPSLDTGDTAGGTETDAQDGDSSGDGETDFEATAQVRLIHASPDAGPIDIYPAGEDEPLVSGLAYGEASDWLPAVVGDLAVELRPAGAPSDSESVFRDTLTLTDGDRTSVVAAGLLEGGDAAFRLLPILEDWGNELAGRARVRVVHAGADAPTVTLGGLGEDAIPLDRFAATDEDGLPLGVEGGERIRLFDGDQEVTSFTAPPIAEGDEVLIVATGLLGSAPNGEDGFGLLAIGSEGPLGLVRQDPQLFTLHGSRDAEDLEVCTGSVELAGNFLYSEIQSTRISPGTYDLDIYEYPSGCTGTSLNGGSNTTGALEAGERYLLLVTGEQNPEAEEASIQVVTFLDRFERDNPGGSSVRFVHGASAQQIYVGSVTNSEIVDANVYTTPIGWRAESEEALLMQGFYLLGVADAVGEPAPPLSPLVEFDFTSSAGARQWGIVSGDPSPEDGDGFIQLMLIDTTTPDWDVSLVDINTP